MNKKVEMDNFIRRVPFFNISLPDINDDSLKQEYYLKIISYYESYYKSIMLGFFTIGIVFFSIFMYLGIMSFFDRFSSFESIIFIYVAIIILLFTLSMVKLFYKVMIRRVNHIFELIEQRKWESNDQ